MPTAPLSTLLTELRRSSEPELPDAELLRRFRDRRDESAFAALVRRHGPLVMSACRRLLDPADADDVFQATFLVLIRQADSVRDGAALSGWLYRVAYRLALRQRKVAEKRRALAECVAASPDLSWREAVAILHEELDRLPEKFRLPLVLCYLDGRSREDAARELGWSAGMVKGRLERGRQALRGRLLRRGVTLSAGLLAVLMPRRSEAVSPALVNSLVRSAFDPAAAPVAAAALAEGAITTMNSNRKWLVAAVGCLVVSLMTGGVFFAQKPAPRANPQAVDGTVGNGTTLTGRVVGMDGKPIAGAKLLWPSFSNEPKSADDLKLPPRATTAADGSFRFELPKEDVHAELPIPLLAAADGYGVGGAERGRGDGPLTIKLPKENLITGRVLDMQGKPVAGVKIDVAPMIAPPDETLDEFLQAWQREPSQALRRIYLPLGKALPMPVTDAAGRFELHGIGVDTVAQVQLASPQIGRAIVYVVNKPHFDPGPVNKARAAKNPGVRPPGANEDVLYGPDFTFVAAATKVIEGRVTDAAGQPLAGIRVSSSSGPAQWVGTETDKDGRYKLVGLSKQPTFLVSATPSDKDTLLSDTVAVNDTEGLRPIQADFTLTRGVVYTGRVIDPTTGKGVIAAVRFAPLADNAYFGKKPGTKGYTRNRTMRPTDSEGRFRIVALPGSGVLLAQVQAQRTADGQMMNPFRLAEFDTEDAKHVEIRGQGRDRYIQTAGTATEFLGIEQAAKYVNAAEGSRPVSVDLVVRRGKTATVLVRDADGQPLTGAMVAGLTESWPITFAVATDHCTALALDPAQPRTLVFLHRGKLLAGTITVRGDEKEPAVVTLRPMGSVSGRLLDRDGQPLAGADVDVYFPEQSASELMRFVTPPLPGTKTDADGRFRRDGVLPGMKFYLDIRKDRAAIGGDPPIGQKQVEPGQTIPVGDVKTKPLP